MASNYTFRSRNKSFEGISRAIAIIVHIDSLV